MDYLRSVQIEEMMMKEAVEEAKEAVAVAEAKVAVAQVKVAGPARELMKR